MKNKWVLPAGITKRFTLSYSARVYLHLPNFLASAFRPFIFFADILKDALLSFGDSAFFTDFLLAENVTLPCISQIVTTRIEGLSPRTFFTADSTSMKNTINQYVIKVSASTNN